MDEDLSMTTSIERLNRSLISARGKFDKYKVYSIDEQLFDDIFAI